jgi:hypothetical protein
MFPSPEHCFLPQKLHREPGHQQTGLLRFSDRICASRRRRFAQLEASLHHGANSPSPDASATKAILVEVPGHMCPLGKHESQSLPPDGRGESHDAAQCKVSIILF